MKDKVQSYNPTSPCLPRTYHTGFSPGRSWSQTFSTTLWLLLPILCSIGRKTPLRLTEKACPQSDESCGTFWYWRWKAVETNVGKHRKLTMESIETDDGKHRELTTKNCRKWRWNWFSILNRPKTEPGRKVFGTDNGKMFAHNCAIHGMVNIPTWLELLSELCLFQFLDPVTLPGCT